jgi:hypothetical protein
MAHGFALGAFLQLATACQPRAHVSAPRLALAIPVTRIDPEVAAAAMARMRGAAYETPIGLHVLDGTTFTERAHAHDSAQRFEALPKGFWTAFHFATDDPSATQAQRSAVDDARLGFYDFATDELFVRANRPLASDRFTIAHEIAHGVQHRLGVRPWHGTTMDEHIARLALVEGDANVMAAAYLALEAHRAVGVSIARIRHRLRSMSAGDLAKLSQLPASVVSAPPLVRARMFFPYVEGTAFAAALYQSGGLALLNAALEHPPVSTEQVLHPEKYLAGELPIEVSPPIVDGSIVDHGTLGELQTAVYLGQCMDQGLARRLAEGWGGDAYTVVVDDEGQPVTLWSTVWDTEGAAIRFAAAIRARERCPATGRTPQAVRREKRVAVVDAPDPTKYDVEDLLARVRPARAAAPPVGDVVLRNIPPPETQFLHRGHVIGNTFTSDELGISASFPSGADVSTTSEGIEFSFRATSQSGMLGFLFEPLSVELEEDVARRIAATFTPSSKAGVQRIPARAEYVIRLPLGLADVEDLRAADGKRALTAFAPVCDGEATVVLFGFAHSVWGVSQDGWFDSVELAGESPACTYLRALASPTGGPSAATAALGGFPSKAPPVNLAEAKARLAAIADDVQSCKGNGPSGEGRVTLVFAPTGVLQSVTLRGLPFEGTPVADCVMGRFKQARLPPFDGPPFAATKSFSIE